jgi:hypothetical protein
MNSKISTNPIQVLSTKSKNEYLVLVNWYEEPVDASSINTTIYVVQAIQEGFNYQPRYDLEERIMAIQHASNQDAILALTTDGRILELSAGKTQLKTDIERFSNDMLVDKLRGVIWIAHDEGIAAVSNAGIRYIDLNTEINHLYRLNDGSLLAVGDKGLVLQLIDKEWQKIASVPTKKRLVSAFQSVDGTVWICGWGGVLFQWDLKSTWNRIKTRKDNDVVGIGQFKDEIYVCCNDGVCVVDDDELKLVKNTFSPVSCYTESHRMIFIGGGELIHFSGSSWTGGAFSISA